MSFSLYAGQADFMASSSWRRFPSGFRAKGVVEILLPRPSSLVPQGFYLLLHGCRPASPAPDAHQTGGDGPAPERKRRPSSGEPLRHFLDHGVLYRSQAAGFSRQGDTELRLCRDQAGVPCFHVRVERFGFREDAAA